MRIGWVWFRRVSAQSMSREDVSHPTGPLVRPDASLLLASLLPYSFPSFLYAGWLWGGNVSFETSKWGR